MLRNGLDAAIGLLREDSLSEALDLLESLRLKHFHEEQQDRFLLAAVLHNSAVCNFGLAKRGLGAATPRVLRSIFGVCLGVDQTLLPLQSFSLRHACEAICSSIQAEVLLLPRPPVTSIELQNVELLLETVDLQSRAYEFLHLLPEALERRRFLSQMGLMSALRGIQVRLAAEEGRLSQLLRSSLSCEHHADKQLFFPIQASRRLINQGPISDLLEVRGASADREGLGVFARKKIPKNQFLFAEKDVPFVGAATIEFCASCARRLRPDASVKCANCAERFCSVHCQQFASQTYHERLCGASVVLDQKEPLGKPELARNSSAIILAKMVSSMMTQSDYPEKCFLELYPGNFIHIPQEGVGPDAQSSLAVVALLLRKFDRLAGLPHVTCSNLFPLLAGLVVNVIDVVAGHCSAYLPLYCLMNHSCDCKGPDSEMNTRQIIPNHDSEAGVVLGVMTNRIIREGEELLISYVGDSVLQHRKMRLRQYGFTCKCSRCVKEGISERFGSVSMLVYGRSQLMIPACLLDSYS